jgi:biofilm PGA synthesis protein PgaA
LLQRTAVSIGLAGALILLPPTQAAASPAAERLNVDAMRQDARSVSDWMEQARMEREARRWPQALHAYAEVLAAEPEHREALRERALTLEALGSADQAFRQYRARPTLFSASEALGFEMRHAARRLNWAQLEARPQQRELELGQVLSTLETLLERAEREDVGAAQRLDNDRLLALNLLLRHEEVVARVEQRSRDGIELPGWLRVSVADSYMALRRPAEAQPLLEAALSEDPDSEAATVLLAYALIEQEEFDAARHLMADWLRSNPPFDDQGGRRWSRAGVELNAILIESFSEQLATAHARIQQLHEVAPLDAGLLDAKAGIERRRGWAETALTSARMARTAEPEALSPRTTELEILLDLNRDIEARPLFEKLVAEHGQHRRTRSIQERWERRQGAQWAFEALRADSRLRDGGDLSPIGPGGSGEFRSQLRIEGPLIRDRYRLSAGYGVHWADFQGRRVERERLFVGASSRKDRIGYGVELGQTLDEFETEHSLGAWLDFRHNDAWRSAYSAWRHAPFASLQARAAGIRADGLRASVSHSPDERSRSGLSLEQLRYEDGNVRSGAYASHRQRLSADAHREWYARGGLGYGRSTRRDAPYFNPSQDASLDLGLTVDQMLWREYGEAWRLRLDFDVSRSWQEGFGSHWVPAIEIMPRWLLRPGSEYSLGLRCSLPVYDGNREVRWALVLRMGGGE